MTSTELVGPLPVVHFWDGTRIVYAAPRDTMDLRYALCRDHHPACDCREAEHAETVHEWRTMWQDARKAAQDVLAGHTTFETGVIYRRTFTGWKNGKPAYVLVEAEEPLCQCTGCVIARRAYLR